MNDCVVCGNPYRAQRPSRAKNCSSVCKTRGRGSYTGWNERSTSERILHRCEQNDNGCLVWRGAVANSGYGRIGWRVDAKARSFQVHRVAYETWIGPIPEGFHIDHTCDNRLCVNPDHLEAVTQAENNRRVWARGRRG